MLRLTRWLFVVGLLSAGLLAAGTPAHAQFWGGPRGGGGGGFFGGIFGDRPQYERQRPPREREYEPRHESPADAAHAPPPRKTEAKDAPAPTTSILVMGDGMADWLAYGLEDAFADSPDIAVVRKDKPYSGLLRYDAKNDLDWWHVAHDILAEQKPSYVVMMLGVTDRQNIRERDLAKEAEREAKEQDEKKAAEAKKAAEKKAAEDKKAAEANPPADKPAESADAATPDKPAAETKTAEQPKPKRIPTGSLEFRSEQWERIYTKRIDETIAALKSKGVPVFWVGLPPIRGTKSTADTSYLDGLFRARAQRAGIVYIDVWDGFVDEDGKYSNYGPDYEGQRRRLRSADGVYFTKYGARKLAHYVEREIRRYMSNRIVALPSPTAVPAAPSKPSERPLAGPVVPLAALPANSDQLAGSGGRVHGDALAARVLVKGDAVGPQPGRADDFAWPQGSTPKPAVAEPARQPDTKAVGPARSVAPVAAIPPAPAQPPAPAKPAEPASVPPAATPAPASAEEAEASAKQPVEPAQAPAPPVAAVPAPAAPAATDEQLAPAAIVAPEAEPAPAEEAKPKQKPQTRRAEARPRPPHHTPRPSRPPPPQQRGPGNPFGELFSVFR